MTYGALAFANLLRTPGRTIVRIVVWRSKVAVFGTRGHGMTAL